MTEAHPLPRLGKYELRGELGRGAMGVVHRAWDLVMHREVALKTMSAPQSDKAQALRFLREARTAGSLHHPNIVTIHELGQHSGTYYIAMELLEGQSLRDVITSGQLPPIPRRLEMVARLCDGLDYAHRAGIVHRDIKPANIFLPKNGSLKILDFGIAKIASSDATRTGILIGTLNYMSPEQVRSAKNLDGRSDIFSAGVILYELLLRRRPFAADDFGATLHRILHQQPPGMALFDKVFPPELAEVLRRSLDKRREARFARAGEMAEALDRVGARLGGRAGTELAERIEELIASGVLERKDADGEPPLAGASGGGAVADKPRAAAALGRTVTSEHRLARPRRKWVLAVVAVALLALAAVLALRPRNADGDAAAPTAVDPAGTAPVEAAATPEGAPGTDGDGGSSPAVPVARGGLSVAVMPWANIAWIENLETGERLPSDASTPARLELPEGRYRLRLVNPYAARPLDLDARVSGGETAVIRGTMPGFDAAELAADILAREGPGG